MKGLVKEQKAKAADLMEQKKVRIESAADAVRLLKAKIAHLQGLRGLDIDHDCRLRPPRRLHGRADLLFGEKFAMDVDSPVSLPPISASRKLSWYHYDNNTTSILQRNIGEDLGVGAVADSATGESTVLEETCCGWSRSPPNSRRQMAGGRPRKLDAQSAARATLYKKSARAATTRTRTAPSRIARLS